jgi:hypothetical protein
MGSAAMKAKQGYNKKHYSQVKVSAPHIVAQKFKAACVLSGTSMSAELVKFMAAYADATDALTAPAARRKQVPLTSRDVTKKASS